MPAQLDPARHLWNVCETIHAVTYFAPACHQAMADAGTRGFWMGYFVGRMAPLGPIGPEVATAVCFGFSPARTERALADGWSYVSPSEAIVVRGRAVAVALRSVAPDIDDQVASVLDPLADLVDALDPSGRPLGAANLGVPMPDDPVEKLWQLTTTLREHRGDGHIACWVAEGIDGLAANVLTTVVLRLPLEILQGTRAWSDDEWEAATQGLMARGLLTRVDDQVAATDEGRALHRAVEARTDAVALASYGPTFDEEQVVELADRMRPIARRVTASGVLPFPNPTGVRPASSG